MAHAREREISSIPQGFDRERRFVARNSTERGLKLNPTCMNVTSHSLLAFPGEIRKDTLSTIGEKLELLALMRCHLCNVIGTIAIGGGNVASIRAEINLAYVGVRSPGASMRDELMRAQ